MKNFEMFLNEGKKYNKIWFTSDIHFDDDRLNLFGRDLVFKNSLEFDNHIVEQWNKNVGKNDLVIVVGDVSLTKKGLENMNKLNGKKHLVKGNYDVAETAKYEVNDKLLEKYFDKVVDDMIMEIGGEKVYINHYPTNTKEEYFNIVGHIHGTWKVQRNMINVGCDAWHFTPVSEDMIKFQINGIRNHYDQNVFAGELLANTENRTGKIKVLRAPEYDNCITENDDNVIFLMGPIQGAEEWQEKFIKDFTILMKDVKLTKNIIIASPKRLEKSDNFVYDEQVDWESYYLEKASKQGVIFCWLAKEKEEVKGRSYAQTTRFEIGEWWTKGQNIKDFKMIIGADKNFNGTRYIEYKFKKEYPKFELYDNFSNAINVVKKLLK